MFRAGTSSWSISVSERDQGLERALWIRAAERIPVAARGFVPGPADVDPLPEPSLPSGEALAESWSWWWRTLLDQDGDRKRALSAGPPTPAFLAALSAQGPPGFDVLADHPALRRVVAARWTEADAWHADRERAGNDAFRAAPDPNRDRDRTQSVHAIRGRISVEGSVVRAVEGELGRAAAPFRLRIIVLPVLDEQIRDAGDGTYLVPERVHATGAYGDWLNQVVRTLA